MIDYLEHARHLDEAGLPFALAVVVRAEKPTSARPGARAIVTSEGEIFGWVGGSCAQPTVMREALASLRDGQPRLVRLTPPEKIGMAPQEGVIEVPLTCISGGTLEVYIEPSLPQPHLVIIGHLPVAESLARLGKGLNYRVSVVGLDVHRDRYPGVDLVLDHLDLSRVRLSGETFIVVASHGNYDEEALVAALGTSASYIALVSSRQRAQSVLQYLRDTGLEETDLSRVKYPAGLDLGAETPEEIALSVLAEIVQVRRGGQTLDSMPVSSTVEPASRSARDPVCGMMVEIDTARYTHNHLGEIYYFCCLGCQHSFASNPADYIHG